jgi:rubrerythrin
MAYRFHLLLFVFFTFFMFQTHQAMTQTTYPGSAVCEQAHKNLVEVKEKFQYLISQKENDKKQFAEIENLIRSSILHLEYLADVLKRSDKRPHDTSDTIHAEVKCQRCDGTGLYEGQPCSACSGDGWAWTPSSSGEEKPCGRCNGTGFVGSPNNKDKCPICKGTGWAHSQADPPSGWSGH